MDSIDDRENVDNNSVTTVGGGGSSSIRGDSESGTVGPSPFSRGQVSHPYSKTVRSMN